MPGELLGDRTEDVGDRLQHALAAEARVVAVAQLERLVLAGRRAGRDGRTAERAVVERHIDLDGGIAARIEDLAGVDVFDQGHGGSMVPDALVRPGISPTRTTAARTTTRSPIGSNPSFAYSSFGQSSSSAWRNTVSAPPARASSAARCTTARAEPAVAELLERVHVLDLGDRPPDVELAHRGDLAVDPRAEEPRAGVAFAALLGSRRASARSPPTWPTARAAARSRARAGASPGRPPRPRRPRRPVRRPSLRHHHQPVPAVAGARQIRRDRPAIRVVVDPDLAVREPGVPEHAIGLGGELFGVGDASRRSRRPRGSCCPSAPGYPSFRYAVPHVNGTSRVLTLATTSRSNASVRASASGSGSTA